MKSNVLIFKAFGQYWLYIESANLSDNDKNFIRLIPSKRLIEALDVARSLQLHVDNSAELALNQYKVV